MKVTIISSVALTLILLLAVPVGGAPALQRGSHSSYDLSVAISFFQSCGFNPPINTMIVCPMIAVMPGTVNINGTLGWNATNITRTTAFLNVTRDLTISLGDSTVPMAHNLASFNESIDLATRIVSIEQFFMQEVEDVFSMAQASAASALPAGASWSSSVSTFTGAMIRPGPVYTMWWVNGPLHLNQTVPVLTLPTNVTGTTTVDLGSGLGTRTAWTLVFSLPRPLLEPEISGTVSIPVRIGPEVTFTFNYDQKSDLLLTASADIHFGFFTETTFQPAQCNSPTTVCSTTSSPAMMVRNWGIDIQASLNLTNTSLDLNQRLTPTSSSQNGNSGSQSGTGTGTRTGQGSGSGPGTGSNPGSNSGTGTGSDSGTGNGPSGGGQPASNPPRSTPMVLFPGTTPWIYWILGIIAVAIPGTGLWIAGRRTKRMRSQTLTQPTS